MLVHVLVPLDGSIFARNAISYARKILRPGGKFTLLSVYEDASLSYVSHHYMYNGGYHEQMVERGIHVQEKYLEGLARQLRDLGYVVECMVTRGVPARTIAELADKQQVDAIVMNTHGRTGLEKLILGSVASHVSTLAHTPMFFVPSKAITWEHVLEDFRDELNAIDDISIPAEQEMLTSALKSINHTLEQDELSADDKQTLLQQLEESLLRVEISHPVLAAVTNQAMWILTNLGI